MKGNPLTILVIIGINCLGLLMATPLSDALVFSWLDGPCILILLTLPVVDFLCFRKKRPEGDSPSAGSLPVPSEMDGEAL
jgi:hypothetical protein